MQATLSTKKVMVVEDFGSIRSYLCKSLESKGFITFGASNGEEALSLIQQHEEMMDLIITDFNMPKLNGMGLLDALNKDAKTSNIPVIVLSTEKDPLKMKEAKEKGVKAWIPKPYKIQTFFAMVNKVLGSNG